MESNISQFMKFPYKFEIYIEYICEPNNPKWINWPLIQEWINSGKSNIVWCNEASQLDELGKP